MTAPLPTPLDDTGSHLLRAVCESPEEDTPRLAYADWLDEHDGLTECSACGGSGLEEAHLAAGLVETRGCPVCSVQSPGWKYRKGTGKVANGYAARAEFIRVQVALSQVDLSIWQDADPQSDMCWSCWIKANGHEHLHRDAVKKFGCQCSGRVTRLRARERELLTRRGCDWFALPGLATWTKDGTFMGWVSKPQHAAGDGIEAEVARGFVDAITLPCSDFLAHAGAVFRRHPVRVVTLSDREPLRFENRFLWHDGDSPLTDDHDYGDHLPKALFNLLEGSNQQKERPRPARFIVKAYRSLDEANAALGFACLAFGRAAARETARA